MLLILSAFFCFKAFYVYIKIPMKKDICLRYHYEIVVYIHMLMLVSLLFYYIWVKIRDVTFWYQSSSNLRRPMVMGLFGCALIGLLVKLHSLKF